MTVPSVEPAQIAPDAPVPPMVVFVPDPARRSDLGDRRARREERRHQRRLRRLYTLAGIAVLAGFLAATVVVVGLVR